MRLIRYLIVNVAALLITAYLIPGFLVEDFMAAVVAAVVIGIINTLVKPVIQLLTLPLTILTLGLFSFVLNVIFLIIAAEVTPGFDIATIGAAVFGSIVLSVVSSFLSMLTKD